MVDMRQYASTYVKPDNVREGPIQTRIVNVFVSERLGRPVLELETGSQFTVNETNCNALIQAWGHDSDTWIGKDVELSLGTYQNWKTKTDDETVKVRAILPAKSAAGNSGAANKPTLPPSRTAAQGGPTSLRGEMDDDVPFAPEWR
jgi:hypothetical protein